MKNLLKIIVNAIGWKRALAMVWDLCDDGLKEAAAKSESKLDDEAIKVIDVAIKTITAAEA